MYICHFYFLWYLS